SDAAKDLHNRFAAAAMVEPKSYEHPLVLAAQMLTTEAKLKHLKRNNIEDRRFVPIPGTSVTLVFWQTTGGDTLVLKRDPSRKPGAWLFATRYPGKLSFDDLVTKYEDLAKTYSDRLARIGEADLAVAA